MVGFLGAENRPDVEPVGMDDNAPAEVKQEKERAGDEVYEDEKQDGWVKRAAKDYLPNKHKGLRKWREHEY
jgi:hypothetical protein